MSAQIEIAAPEPTRGIRIVGICLNIYLRILAVLFFALAVHTWMKAVGYYEGPQNSFDTMGTAARIYTAIMVVILPVTSVGLWTTLSWGRVVWFFAIGVQTAAILRFGDDIALMNWMIVLHLISLLIYLMFQLSLGFITKKG